MSNPTSRKGELACPEGHTKGLQLRSVVDTPFERSDGTLVPLYDDQKEIDMMIPAGRPDPGNDGGVWCPKCEDWYDEDEIKPVPEKKP